MSLNFNSPIPIARVIVATTCVPVFPPVPTNNGTKKARATTVSISSSKYFNTVPVYASATKRSNNHGRRF